MATTTTFLELILPAHDEFTDGWDVPLNSNAQAIDDFLAALRLELDSGVSPSTAFTLKGTQTSLLARLAVGINSDGSLNISSAPEILALKTSTYDGLFATPTARFANTDKELFDSRVRAKGDRYDPASVAAGKLEVGLALRAAEYSGAVAGVPSPIRGFEPNTIVDGPSGHVTTAGGNTAVVDGNPNNVLYNIDGYPFRTRYDIEIDVSSLPGLTPGDTLYFFVERRDYNNVNYKYLRFGAVTPVASDLRVVQSGVDGTVGVVTTTFTAATGLFVTRGVQPGDIVKITGGANAGEYVVLSVGGETTLTLVSGLPAASVSGMTWSVEDRMQPNVGVLRIAPGNDPTAQAGRVYIAEATWTPNVTGLRVYAKNGIFTSTVSATASGGGANFPITVAHNLGAVPSMVELYAATAAGAAEYRDPTVTETISGYLVRMPSVLIKVTRKDIILYAIDPDPTKRLFVDEGGGGFVTGVLRMVLRR